MVDSAALTDSIPKHTPGSVAQSGSAAPGGCGNTEQGKAGGSKATRTAARGSSLGPPVALGSAVVLPGARRFTQRPLTRCLPFAQGWGRQGTSGLSPAPVVAGLGRTGATEPGPWQASPWQGAGSAGFGDAAPNPCVIDRGAARDVGADQFLLGVDEDVVPVGAHCVEIGIRFPLSGGDQSQAAAGSFAAPLVPFAVHS